MKMLIDPTLLYRVPVFSYDATLEECWPELKKSIEISSKVFYSLVEHIKPGDLATLPENIRHTIWKYFNRSRYRATPYGGFAGTGIIELGKYDSTPAVIANYQHLQRFADWTCTGQLTISFADLVKADALVFANSTYYFTESDIRYIGRFDDGYELADIPKDKLRVRILEACAHPQTISSLFEMINESADRPTFLHVLETMLADQLLISQMQPNIIGQDYFQRVNFSPAGQEYIIAQRPLIQGGVDPHLFKHLPGLIEKLHQMLPSYKSPELDQFIQRFIKKFGAQEVPVMVALDPELGIGYGGMDQSVLTSELINQLIKKADDSSEDITNSTLRVLLPRLITDKPTVIDFEKLEIPAGIKNEPLPNSLPVLCTVADGMILLEHLGGCTANSLLGRFTLSSDNVLAHCRKIAAIEQQANPGVLFFDVAYTVGGVVDNVNRRRPIYDLQVSILNYDTSADPVLLNDLLLSVQGGELIIRSQKHNRRMVPRLASAYNYLLSDLPVFRLFCDLQHQSIHKNLYLRLRDRIANLNYYPRLQYRNIILSPATWLIRLEDVLPNGKTGTAALLVDHLEQRGISGFVRVGSTDQTLCIDTSREVDIIELFHLLQKQKSLYLEETIIPKRSVIEDTNTRPYVSQLLVTLHHGQTTYRPAPSTALQQQDTGIEKIIPPGDEWLYFEIFCHPARTDELLTGDIQEFLETHRDQIMRWFFIRYTDQGNHIRLRFRLRKAEASQQIMAAFTSLLKEKIQVGVVSDLSIRLYRRETERYGVANIFFVEVHFHLDSRFVLSVLRHQLSDEEKYFLCITLVKAVQEKDIFTQGVFLKTIDETAHAFNTEHSLDPGRFKLLNVAWTKYGSIQAPALDNEAWQNFNALSSSFADTLYQYPVAERPGIFNSLFHMHINRMFPMAQRTHEMIIYYFLQKDIKSAGRRNAVKEHAEAIPAGSSLLHQ
ncbi:thiopeptide-type bacteriocin biosynthesis protein [Mucilaginibacter sp. Mucisp86]|uniref:lantibiotic dehydratase n=1 Tax=Mucilaginibacter sp. Mucisp86 TaxID=3243060 RepID=UPI0039B6BC0C